MTQEEINILWQKAMQEAVEAGEMYTRYRFAKLLAEKEREACAKICDEFFKGNKNINYSDTIAICIRGRDYQKGQID
jgi:hypothetical protein